MDLNVIFRKKILLNLITQWTDLQFVQHIFFVFNFDSNNLKYESSNHGNIYQMGQIHILLSLLVIIYLICSIIMYKYTVFLLSEAVYEEPR